MGNNVIIAANLDLSMAIMWYFIKKTNIIYAMKQYHMYIYTYIKYNGHFNDIC